MSPDAKLLEAADKHVAKTTNGMNDIYMREAFLAGAHYRDAEVNQLVYEKDKSTHDHCAKISKLMEIIEMQREALQDIEMAPRILRSPIGSIQNVASHTLESTLQKLELIK